MWFETNFKRLVENHLPTFWRKPKMLAWMSTLSQGIDDVAYDFRQNRDGNPNSNLYKMRHNGQICYMQAALNDRFDTQKRRIRIADGNRYKRQYIYTRGEQKPKRLGTMYLRDRADYEDTGVDFIALVPADVIYDDYDMRAVIDFYRLGSKRYKIERI